MAGRLSGNGDLSDGNSIQFARRSVPGEPGRTKALSASQTQAFQNQVVGSVFLPHVLRKKIGFPPLGGHLPVLVQLDIVGIVVHRTTGLATAAGRGKKGRSQDESEQQTPVTKAKKQAIGGHNGLFSSPDQGTFCMLTPQKG